MKKSPIHTSSSILVQPELHLTRRGMCGAHVLTQYVNNTRTSHNFKFDGVLGEKATQVTPYLFYYRKGVVGSSRSKTVRQVVSGLCSTQSIVHVQLDASARTTPAHVPPQCYPTRAFHVCVVIDRKPMQEDVFAKIGKGAVSNVLNGYNSTVFAYGQTGSGKTFTVTGGAERYRAKRHPCESCSALPWKY